MYIFPSIFVKLKSKEDYSFMDDRFMYQIRPRKPIVNLIPGKGIRKPMSIKLTKEEVKKCIGYGPVYRAFPSIPPIRVTGSNLDSLHVSEEEYLNKDKKEVKPSNSTEKVVEEQKQEVIIPEEPKTEPLTEEKVEEHEEKPIPVPVEPGPVILEPEKKEENPEPVPVLVEPGPVIIEEKDPEKKIEEMKTKEVVFDSEAIPVEEEKEEEPIPVPVEPGPVIVNPEEKEEEPIPVPVEPGPVIVGVVEPQDAPEEEDDEEEEEEETEQPLGPINANGSLQPQSPHRKKKKRH